MNEASRLTQPPGILSQLDSEYAFIDMLPEKLVPAVVTLSGGNLSERFQSLSQLRDQLLAGENIQAPCRWLPGPAQQQLACVINESGLQHYCRDNPEVTDELIADLLRIVNDVQIQASQLIDMLIKIARQQALLQLQQELVALENTRSKNRKKQNPESPKLSDDVLAKIEALAIEDAWTQITSGPGGNPFALASIWEDRLAVWQALEGIFSDLGLIAGLGWDLSRGLLQSHGWLNMVKLNRLLKSIPQLTEVIETLGRMKDTDGLPVIEEIVTYMAVSSRQKVEIPTPFVPMETKGVTRSDSISRMLPQEAAFLGHPTLKKLWHARRAEHTLLTYAVEGTEFISQEVENLQQVTEQKAGNNKRKNMGPMIVCLDTSGSMKGTPENVAKALVLQCISVAKTERRDCFVYLFGSKGEVEELELTPDAEGLERMILFLSMSFGGGTDAEGPLQLALERSDQQQWRNADILLVSDGEFTITSGLSRKIKNRKLERALSVHGIVIGGQLSPMDKICEPLHQFSSWLDLQNNVYQ